MGSVSFGGVLWCDCNKEEVHVVGPIHGKMLNLGQSLHSVVHFFQALRQNVVTQMGEAAYFFTSEITIVTKIRALQKNRIT